MYKSILVFTICILSCATTYAQDLCPTLTGTWKGSYHDPEHLFESGNFPIQLRLVYDDGKIFGYTEKSNDQMAANFGTKPYLIWANCRDSKITDFTSIPQNRSCGDHTHHFNIVNQRKFLTVYLHWENAMIGTDVIAKLHRIEDKQPLNGKLIHVAQNDSTQNILSCH